jgi:hypothetical protein
MTVSGTGIPANTVINSIDSPSQITLNNNATSSGSYTLTFKVPNSTTVDTCYDVCCFDVGGTPLLTLVKWTNNSTRANALTTQDGVYCLTNAVVIGGTSYAGSKLRYIGTIRTTDTDGQIEDSFNTRYIFNMYNRLTRFGWTHNTNASWTYASTVYREANGGTGQVRFKFVIGQPSEIRMTLQGWCTGAASGSYTGAALDRTTDYDCNMLSVNGGYLYYGYWNQAMRKTMAVGYHFGTQVEWSNATGTYNGSGSTTENGYGGTIFILEM